MAEQEQRVVLRCRPYSTFAQPPRHLNRIDVAEGLTHWIPGVVGWDAPDPASRALRRWITAQAIRRAPFSVNVSRSRRVLLNFLRAPSSDRVVWVA
jgi:hypothetical protein